MVSFIGNAIKSISQSPSLQEVVGGLFFAGIAGFFALAVILFLGGYFIYLGLVWSKIGKNVNYDKTYLAWIPFARTSLILEIGGFHWALVFLYLVPILGWGALFVLRMIATWRVFEELHYPGPLALIPLTDVFLRGIGGIAHLVILGFVAWRKPIGSLGLKK